MAKLCTIAGSSLVIVVLLSIESRASKLNEAYSWKKADFVYPNQIARLQQIHQGVFVPEVNLPLGLEVWQNKLFVTFPRLRPGVAATLAYIDLDDPSGNKSPALIPYPDWYTHQLNRNGTKIVSVWRLNVDVCDRLWIVDTGTEDYQGNAHQILPPRVLVYDLKTDQLILEYTLKKEHIKADSLLLNIIVDVTKDTCDKAFAYIADCDGYGLIVYDLEKNDSWRIEHNFFHMDPLVGNYNIAGVNYQSVDGIFGLALSALNDDGYRTLYFHPLSSYNEFAVSTQVLQQNQTGIDSYYEYKLIGSRGPDSQGTGSSLDENTGVLFYSQIHKNGIGCWNSVKNAHRYSTHTNVLIASDNETLIFPTDVKVDKNGNLWVLSDRFSTFYRANLDYSDTNFRIFTAPVADIIKGTVCDTGYPSAAIQTISTLSSSRSPYSWAPKAPEPYILSHGAGHGYSPRQY